MNDKLHNGYRDDVQSFEKFPFLKVSADIATLFLSVHLKTLVLQMQVNTILK